MKSKHQTRMRRQPAGTYKAMLRGMASYIRRRGYNDDLHSRARSYRLMLRKTLMLARLSLAPKDYDAFFFQLRRQTLVESNRLKEVPVGSDFMNGVIETARLSLAGEIEWVASRLAADSDELNKFVDRKEKIDAFVWACEFDQALSLLDTVEADFGVSMWQIGLRIALEQRKSGLEAQKDFVARLRRQYKGSLIPYVAHYISVRNEPTVTWSWYVDDTRRRVDQSHFKRPLKTYFKYHFLRQWPSSEIELADILRYEQCHANMDLYETFVSLAQHIVATRDSDDLRSVLGAALVKLERVQDKRLIKIEKYLSNCRMDATGVGDDAACVLVKGDISRAYRIALNALNLSPTETDHALVAAFARATHGSRTLPSRIPRLQDLWSIIVIDLVRVFQRNSDYLGGLDRLRKLACNFSATKPANALFGVVGSEASTEMLRPLQDLRLIGLNIERITFCEAQAGQLLQGHQSDVAISFFLATHHAGVMCPDTHPDVRLFGEAIAAARKQEWETASDKAAKCRASTSHKGLQRRATLFESNARVRLDQVAPVAALVEKEVAEDGILADLFPNVEMVEGKSWADLSHASDSIGLSICLDIALKASGNDKIATHRRFAYDAFLRSQGVDRASQLNATRYPARVLSYFLKNVGVSSVLDMSDALESTKAIQEERRSILSMLTIVDPEGSLEYQDEILDITDRLALAEGLRLVDSSRIHVDTDAIESWAVRELTDGYRRYRTLLETGIGVADDFDLVLASLRKADEKSNLFVVPINEADDLLISVTQQLLERFLYDPAHGLDSYLSRRIRHGSIVGFLRGPVEEARLVTLRDENDSSYALNTFWLDQLNDLTLDEKQMISGYLRDFARDYDNSLIRLRDQLVQIKDKEHTSGLIDMRLYADVFHLIRSAIKTNDSFSTFVFSCFAAFWGLLDRYLAACRLEISGNLRTALGSAFDELRSRVNQLYAASVTGGNANAIEHRKGLAELNGSITSAQNNLQAALEDVQTWFARSDVELAKRIYPLREAMNIAIQSALARLRSYNPNIDLHCADLTVPAEDLSVIAEIVLVTLTNACEHSGGDKEAEVCIKVARDDSGSQLVFYVSNPVAEEKRSQFYIDRVQSIRDEIASGSATDAIRKDRRSGLRKLGALKKRFAVAKLGFGFAEKGESFLVEFSVPFKEVRSVPHTPEVGNADSVGRR